MNMSMDKPMALNRAKGTRGPQVEKCKNDLKNKSPGHENQNMYMSMDKPMTLNRAEGTRVAQVQNPK